MRYLLVNLITNLMKYLPLLILALLATQISSEITQLEHPPCPTPPTCTAPKVARGCQCVCDSTPCTQPYQKKNRDTCQCYFACPEGKTYNAATGTCDCTTTETCLSVQTWNADRCRCECNDPPATCAAGQRWNHKTCACEIFCPEGKTYNPTTSTCDCSTTQTCTAPYTWNTDKCRCLCPTPPQTCASNFYWDKQECKCEIRCSRPLVPDAAGTACVCPNTPASCPANRVWSTTRCLCECKPASTECPTGDFRWDYERCACVCRNRCGRGRQQDPATCLCF